VFRVGGAGGGRVKGGGGGGGGGGGKWKLLLKLDQLQNMLQPVIADVIY